MLMILREMLWEWYTNINCTSC